MMMMMMMIVVIVVIMRYDAMQCDDSREWYLEKKATHNARNARKQRPASM
jgi:hypothetical protein